MPSGKHRHHQICPRTRPYCTLTHLLTCLIVRVVTGRVALVLAGVQLVLLELLVLVLLVGVGIAVAALAVAVLLGLLALLAALLRPPPSNWAARTPATQRITPQIRMAAPSTLPRNIKEVVAQMKDAVQTALQNRISRIDVELPQEDAWVSMGVDGDAPCGLQSVEGLPCLPKLHVLVMVAHLQLALAYTARRRVRGRPRRWLRPGWLRRLRV